MDEVNSVAEVIYLKLCELCMEETFTGIAYQELPEHVRIKYREVASAAIESAAQVT